MAAILAWHAGMWCDAMLTLIHVEWPRARDHLMAPATSSAHAVVQAWMQATQVQVTISAPLFTHDAKEPFQIG